MLRHWKGPPQQQNANHSDQQGFWEAGLDVGESLFRSHRLESRDKEKMPKQGSENNAFSAVCYLAWKWVFVSYAYVLVSFPRL